MIEMLLENWGEVNLFTRPRRFGKSLNMSMLRHFFEIGTAPSLFDGLSISKNQKYNVVAHIEKTNNSLNWINDYGKLISHRCVIDNKYLEAAPRKIPSCCS